MAAVALFITLERLFLLVPFLQVLRMRPDEQLFQRHPPPCSSPERLKFQFSSPLSKTMVFICVHVFWWYFKQMEAMFNASQTGGMDCSISCGSHV